MPDGGVEASMLQWNGGGPVSGAVCGTTSEEALVIAADIARYELIVREKQRRDAAQPRW